MGRFAGPRKDLESALRLPASVAGRVLDDPRRRAYLVAWSGPGGRIVQALKIAPAAGPDTVLITDAYGLTIPLRSFGDDFGEAAPNFAGAAHEMARSGNISTWMGMGTRNAVRVSGSSTGSGSLPAPPRARVRGRLERQ
jgi:hypothetical protein